ncbi:acid protease [Cristinia sonorae]|uniref:Acid protease n=1 Tax=Cristinia sonorae TaxID=1940300 RepID=A0A8K0XUC8_9AGAR|nr:acid protease [Cristinia sonorae]
MPRSSVHKMRAVALLATCLAVTVSPSYAAGPKILKTKFTSTLVDISSAGGKALGFSKVNAGNEPDAPATNAILKAVATVEAGNNQEFTEVLIDTGSAILWVGGEEAYEPGPNSKLIGDFSIGYGIGGAGGPAYTDRVKIGDAVVNSQIIGAANATSGLALVKPIDGILGLGPANSNSGQIIGFNSTPTFIESLVNEGVIHEPVFGIEISSLDAGSGNQITTGEITFGGIDEDRIVGDVVWLDQLPPINFRWSFNVTSFSFGTRQLSTDTMPGRTDTGVLLIGLPFDFLFDVLRSIPGTTIVSDGVLGGTLAFPSNVTADSLPPFNLGLGDQLFELPASKYLVPKPLYTSLNLTEDFTYSWLGSAGQGSFMLGQKWLENIYTAYDMEGHRVGFAHLK